MCVEYKYKETEHSRFVVYLLLYQIASNRDICVPLHPLLYIFKYFITFLIHVLVFDP